MKIPQILKLPLGFKRKLAQIAAFGFTNIHMENFCGGRLYKGPWKQFCSPGLNCYSCPAAGLACPIGAFQAVSGSMNYDFSFYVAGFLMAVGVLFGRLICGWLCPFGLVQEALGRIPLNVSAAGPAKPPAPGRPSAWDFFPTIPMGVPSRLTKPG